MPNPRLKAYPSGRQRVLLTGFGPFPGVPNNISIAFSNSVATALRQQNGGLEIETAILPVEWQAIAICVRALYETSPPNLAVHFGVSSQARGLVLEQTAHNACAPERDACGHLPDQAPLSQGKSARRATALNIADLISGLPAASAARVAHSHDAGRYLCNAAYFVSLTCAEGLAAKSTALFIHLPQDLHPNVEDWSLLIGAAAGVIENGLRQLSTRYAEV